MLHLQEELFKGKVTEWINKEKSPSHGGIRTHDLLV